MMSEIPVDPNMPTTGGLPLSDGGVDHNSRSGSICKNTSELLRTLEHQFRRMKMPQQIRRKSQERASLDSDDHPPNGSIPSTTTTSTMQVNGNGVFRPCPSGGSNTARCAPPTSMVSTTRGHTSGPAQRPGLNLQLPQHLNGNGQPESTAGCSTSPLPRRNMNLQLGGIGGRDSSVGAPITPRLRAQQEWTAQSPMQTRVSDAGEIQRTIDEIMDKQGVLQFEIDGKFQSFKADPSRDLENLESLGSGSCGQVYKMRHRQTGRIMAVKQMTRTGNREENKRAIMDMKVVLQSHSCPFIVQCYGCFINDAEVWICMELMSTCLDKLSKRCGPIPENILGKMTVSILKALHYLKMQLKVIHRDVKPSNILLDTNGTVKLCDFGISGQLVDSKAQSRAAGCLAYMAPERIDINCEKYDVRADVWSLGITLVELATGKFPYPTSCGGAFVMATTIINNPAPVLHPSERFSVPFCQFVERCLQKNADNRPKYDVLLNDPFIKFYETEPVNVGDWFKRAQHKSRHD